MLIVGEIMSYYFKNKYQFTNHGLLRIKDRLNLKTKTDLEIINYCSKLIDLSHEIYETNTMKYVKINNKNLYFVINKNGNLILTLSPIKPEKLLANLENNY